MLRRASCILSICFTLSLIGAAQQPLETPLQKLEDQPLPLTVSSGTMRNFQYTSQVHASLSTNHQGSIKSADFFLMVVNGQKVISGEGWTEENPSGTIEHDAKLVLHSGDKAFLMIDKVVTETRTFTVNKAEIGAHILQRLRGEASTLPAVQISMLQLTAPVLKRVQGGPSYCSESLAAAVATCGPGQVASFSCNDTAHSFSFSCKGNTPTQPGPGEN